MKAAVVTAFDVAPVYTEFPEPVATGPHDIVVDVVAAGLHPRVRSQADGSHYTSTDELPLVPGVDGVGRDPDGRLRYFVLDGTVSGSMAERTVVDARRSVVLPDGVGGPDPVAVAAAMNPAMSSWVALRRRIGFRAGQDVLVLGATGNAGRTAVQVARRLGAGRIVAAGRNADLLAGLPALGATATTTLDAGGLGAAAADVDVVLDYVWGEPTAAAMAAVVTARADRSRPLTWVEIGSVAGPTAAIGSAALRAARLEIVGSGQGSVPTGDIVAELAALAGEIGTGTFAVDAAAVPLSDVERAWGKSVHTGRRIVMTP
ncbi:quinone oxidoreductase family protein [Pseudonocardia endophytica]|uniref:NADPH:quinone reductase-like Zn-dependent oxidoreductase n=1 Tax=Pseudonocardia endophytica TaxID=401976 RepID=A0A4R1HXK8_PSEEN|nr:zinc-binding alcohol dehydrogenase family protein [Pseudonocardia endophytica]TCK27507.1 NADPH:quinone reductase-like Zn-dependent oxidoreductase [Pseudonocardia endophytica]